MTLRGFYLTAGLVAASLTIAGSVSGCGSEDARAGHADRGDT